MIAQLNTPCLTACIPELQARFLKIWPRVELHARIHFRGIKCWHKKEDHVAETVALAWRWFLRLVKQGKDPMLFPSALAAYAARAVRSGRRLCGMLKAKDAMNELAQQKHNFGVESLPSSMTTSYENVFGRVNGQRTQDTFEERLRDNRQSPVPDQAAFRLDWPEFFNSLSHRDRRLAEFLSLGHSGKKTAAKFKLSPGRVTQIRKRICRDWHHWHGEVAPFERLSITG